MLDSLIRCLVTMKQQQIKKENKKIKVERNIKNKITKIQKILK